VNRQIRQLAVGLMACYVVLFVALNYWQVGRKQELDARFDNTRAVLREFNKPRGPIVTSDGIVAAVSFPAAPGELYEFRREYPTGDLLSDVTGYFTFAFGSTQVEREYGDVLTGSTTEQQVRSLGDLLGGDVDDVDTQRHVAEPVGIQARCCCVAHRRVARADHPVGSTADGGEAAFHHPHALARELAGVVEEGQVVHRHHERRRGAAGNEPGGVGDVDLAGDGFHLRPVEAGPRLVQQRAGQWQHRHRPAGSELGDRRHGVTTRHLVEFDVGPRRQVLGDAKGRHRRAAGGGVPALLERVRHP